MKHIAPYNKAVYGSLAVAVTQIIVYVLTAYDIDVTPELSGALITLITAAVVYTVPNIPAAVEEPEADDERISNV